MEVDPTRLSTYYKLIERYTIPSWSVETRGLDLDFLTLHFEVLDNCDENLACAARSDAVRRVLGRYPSLRRMLETVIGKYGGVFVRSDRASPKDVCGGLATLAYESLVRAGAHPVPGTMDNACIYTRPEAAVAALLMSERIAVLGGVDIIWARVPARLHFEVRVFVKDGFPRLATWYYPGEPLTTSKARVLLTVLENRYVNELLPILNSILRVAGLRDYTVDVAMWNGRPIVVELAPFPAKGHMMVTDTILFGEEFWDALQRAEEEDVLILRYPRPTETTVHQEHVIHNITEKVN